jgi:hypothetical protein
MNATVMTLARYYARKDVEASILRNLGYRALRDMVSAELTRLTNAHLDSHPRSLSEPQRPSIVTRRYAAWQRDTNPSALRLSGETLTAIAATYGVSQRPAVGVRSRGWPNHQTRQPRRLLDPVGSQNTYITRANSNMRTGLPQPRR